MNCLRCRFPSPPDAVYCPRCGRKLSPEQKKCRTKSRGTGTGCAYYSAKYRYWIAQAVVDWRVIAEDKPLVPVKKTKGGFKTRDQALQYCPILKAGGTKEDKAPTLSHYWNLYEKDELTTVGPSKQRAYNTAWTSYLSEKARFLTC